MLIEEAFYSLLVAASAVIAIVDERIYPVTMPQLEKGKTFYPAICFELAERERRYTHDGPDTLVASRLALYSIGPKYFEVKTLADKVRAAVNGQSAALATIYTKHVKGMFIQDEFDDYLFDEVERLSLYRVTMDLMIHHRE